MSGTDNSDFYYYQSAKVEQFFEPAKFFVPRLIRVNQYVKERLPP
jgi:hypothetical protein